MNRKEFLHIGGMSLLGSSVISSSMAESIMNNYESKATAGIAVQLYTIRNEIEKDIEAALKRLKQIGFNAVETAFWPKGISVKQASEYLDKAGLKVISAHVELPVGDNRQSMLDIAKAMECKKVIWHGWPEDKRYSSLVGTKELANIYNESYAFAKANGLAFGIHNHWWEFRNKVDGRFVYEVLLEELNENIFFEIDTYWVKVAGHDPATIVGKFGKRAPLLHIKDGPAIWRASLAEDNPDPMVAVGKGTQNFPAIVKAANGNTEWMIVEMDKTVTDVFEALQQSYDYLIRNNLAKGKTV